MPEQQSVHYFVEFLVLLLWSGWYIYVMEAHVQACSVINKQFLVSMCLSIGLLPLRRASSDASRVL